MVNGMPGPLAFEVAKACLDRNMKLIPYGYTGPSIKQESIEVEGLNAKITVEFLKRLGSAVAGLKLKELKRVFLNLIVVDFTTPTAVSGNLQSYVEANCDFVLGTTGSDPDAVAKVFNRGQNYAVIAPNMAKQIVALQAAVSEATQRFPGAFTGYQLQVTESHQSTKFDTSGTAKAIVKDLKRLNNEDFSVENIVKI